LKGEGVPDLDFKKTDIPFWAGGEGVLRIHVAVPDLTKQLTPTNNDLFSIDFSIGGAQLFSIGASDTVKLVMKASTALSLVPLWPSTSSDRLKIIDGYGFTGYFEGHAHDDRLLLALNVGAGADVNLSTRFQYSILSASASLRGAQMPPMY
jgi:hypothetical protein